ncbi:metallophosphoesterase family protein [Henriciella aquimarina]|uniref:metallophosphoesterase family protein n=1 Tax=Henriciella aquimarina TaxID=545261 RepID=UPI001F33A7D9|nr:metallophosphoesterase family protein [Henriciella aquimarina]
MSGTGAWLSNTAGWLVSLVRFADEATPFQEKPAKETPSTPAPAVIAGDEPVSAPACVPEGMVVYAIGDVHGRADLLESLISIIREDAGKTEATPRLVMLGDYVDRGFQSRQVIDLLMSDKVSGFETVCIKGNHEAAMLKFYEDVEHGPEWANYGGRETLVSYGVRPPRSLSLNEEWHEAHARFRECLPEDHLHFLRSLELSVRIGDYGFVHAGIKPGRAFDDQQEHDLLWIRDEFLKAGEREDVIVVHGHTPADDAYSDNRRINVDTGAYFSGRLTAVRLENEQMSFLKTR